MPLKFGEKNIVISFIVAILFVTVIIFVGIGAALYFGLDNLIALFLSYNTQSCRDSVLLSLFLPSLFLFYVLSTDYTQRF